MPCFWFSLSCLRLWMFNKVLVWIHSLDWLTVFSGIQHSLQRTAGQGWCINILLKLLLRSSLKQVRAKNCTGASRGRLPADSKYSLDAWDQSCITAGLKEKRSNFFPAGLTTDQWRIYTSCMCKNIPCLNRSRHSRCHGSVNTAESFPPPPRVKTLIPPNFAIFPEEVGTTF